MSEEIKNEKTVEAAPENENGESSNTEASDKPEIELVKEELENTKKEHLYLRAEFDNFRRQSIKERSNLLKFGGEAIARDLLNVLDVFQKALDMDVNAENYTSFIDGVKLTETELKNVFSKHGITEIECKEKPFNPEEAEALSQVPTDSIDDGHVFDVMRKGYRYHDKVLRHAQVVIATKPQEN